MQPSKIITVFFIMILIFSVILGAVFYWPVFFPENKISEKNNLSDLIIVVKNDFLEVSTPFPYQKITSPVLISGSSNFFEANTRIRIKDETGKIIADGFASAAGWMDNLYPFSSNVFYSAPLTPKGTVEVFEASPKDGKEQNKIIIPVIFEDYPSGSQKTAVSLYYYNKIKDHSLDPSFACAAEAVLPVIREIEHTKTPIQDSINLLLKGELSEAEEQEGFFTEFPLEGFSLKGANLKEGLLVLEFEDADNKTSGGSCRAGLLWAQIEKTAKQFPEVKEVSFIPETLFQP